jgi:hypothetical protein
MLSIYDESHSGGLAHADVQRRAMSQSPSLKAYRFQSDKSPSMPEHVPSEDADRIVIRIGFLG